MLFCWGFQQRYSANSVIKIVLLFSNFIFVVKISFGEAFFFAYICSELICIFPEFWTGGGWSFSFWGKNQSTLL